MGWLLTMDQKVTNLWQSIGLLVVFLFSLGTNPYFIRYVVNGYFDFDSQILNTPEIVTVPSVCQNLNFTMTADCLNRFAVRNFHYNITDDNEIITFKEMIVRIVDCRRNKRNGKG